MEYLLTGFSPAVDAFAFENSGWSIDEDEAAVILDVVKKAAIAGLAIRPPFVDAVLDSLLLAGPFLAIPQVQDQLMKWLADGDALDAASPAFCCGMCFCALDSYAARVPSPRGARGVVPRRHGTAQEAALRKLLLDRHLDAWKAGAAWATVETKIVQRTQGVDAIRKRSAREVGRLVASLRGNVPVAVLVHQDLADPFSSHCLVAYGAVVSPPSGDTQDIEVFVYDPNYPIGKNGSTPSGWDRERRLKITLEGGLAAPRRVRAMDLVGSFGTWVGLSLTPYAPAAPAVSVVEAPATVKTTGKNVSVTFEIANVGSGEVGPFVVGARATVVTPPAVPPPVAHPRPRPVGGRADVEEPPATSPVVTRPSLAFTVRDRVGNLPQLVAPGTSARAEITFVSGFEALRLSPVLAFTWRSQLDPLFDPEKKSLRTYERRAPGTGAFVRIARTEIS